MQKLGWAIPHSDFLAWLSSVTLIILTHKWKKTKRRQTKDSSELKNEDNFKNEDDLNNEEDLKIEEDLKNEVEL